MNGDTSDVVVGPKVVPAVAQSLPSENPKLTDPVPQISVNNSFEGLVNDPQEPNMEREKDLRAPLAVVTENTVRKEYSLTENFPNEQLGLTFQASTSKSLKAKARKGKKPTSGLVFGPTRLLKENKGIGKCHERLEKSDELTENNGLQLVVLSSAASRLNVDNQWVAIRREGGVMGVPGSLYMLNLFYNELYSMELTGASKPNFRRAIRYLVKKQVVDIIALFETHTSRDSR
ncbi:LOW QUALITY PROTEIN: hypothetical protein V2J09_009293 [Rumex salicifolius]